MDDYRDELKRSPTLINEGALKQKSGVNRNDWRTPRWFFELINSVFDFQVDGATDGLTVNSLLPLCHTAKTAAEDRMEDYRTKRVFINPPFNDLSDGYWFQDAIKATKDNAGEGGLVALLVPMRPETKYWHELVWKHADTIFVPSRRISFIHPETLKVKQGAAFASVLVIYGDTSPYNLSKLDDGGHGVFISRKVVAK
jgi:phage N-6-adenine-methyltransferase